jgi:hypothetical protein
LLLGRRFWELGRAARAKDNVIRGRRAAALMLAEETPSLNIGRIIEDMPPENVRMMLMEWSGVIEMEIRQSYVCYHS